MTYAQIIQLTETLKRMVTLTGDAGHAVARSLSALNREYQIIMQCNTAIFQKYGEAQPDGSYTVKSDSEHKDDFIRERNELMAREVDVKLSKIPKDKFNIDDIYCPEARALDYLIFEEMMVEDNSHDDKCEASRTGETIPS